MTDDTLLLAALRESQRFGALGESPEVALAQSERFLAALGAASSVLDLGSGGGVPGLVIAVRCPHLHLTLLDRRSARTDLLQRLVARLGLADRVTVVTGEAQALSRHQAYREAFDTVVCRSFGPPDVTVALAAPFLTYGGQLVVSEPPTGSRAGDQWGSLSGGLTPRVSPPGLQILRKEPPTPSTSCST